jgi:acyl-CoA reductase-like NAD-dependent aldehyde dehydrogenase
MQVASDAEAVKLMNDSPYGLTASIWTDAAAHPESEAAFLELEAQLQCGTVFLNRCARRWLIVFFYSNFAQLRLSGSCTGMDRGKGQWEGYQFE